MDIKSDVRLQRLVLVWALLLVLGNLDAHAQQVILQSGDGRQVQLLRELRSEDRRVRRRAAEELGRIGGDQAVTALINALRDQDQFVSAAAGLALGEIKDKRAVEPLIVNLRDVNPEVRGAAAVALGRIGDIRAVEPLLTMLSDAEVYPRASAAVALGRIGDVRAASKIATLLRQDVDAQVRTSAAEALGHFGDIQETESLIAALKDRNNYVRTAAAAALGQLSSNRATLPLIEALRDSDRLVRSAAAEALGRSSDVRAVRPLIEAMSDADQFVRTNAAYALGRLGDRQAVEPLMDAVHLDDARIKSRAIDSLGAIGDPRAVPVLIDALNDKDRFTRGNAATSLGKIGDRRAVEPLIQILSETDSYLRRAAADALGRLGDVRAFEPLANLLKTDQEQNVRATSIAALAKLDGTRALVVLVDALKEKSPDVRNSAAIALGQLQQQPEVFSALLEFVAKADLARVAELRPPLALFFKEAGSAATTQLQQALSDPDARRRRSALMLSAILAQQGSFEQILAALKDNDNAMRALAIQLLGGTRDSRAIAPIRQALNDTDSEVRARAAATLSLLGVPKYDLPNLARNDRRALPSLPTRGRESEAGLIAAHVSANTLKTRPPRPQPESSSSETVALANRSKEIPSAPTQSKTQIASTPSPTTGRRVPETDTQPNGPLPTRDKTTNDSVAVNSGRSAVPAPPTINIPSVARSENTIPTSETPKIELPKRETIRPPVPKLTILAENEATIINLLQRIFTAQQQYRRSNANANFATLNELANKSLIEAIISEGEQHGYELTLYISQATAKRPAKFFIIAAPVSYGRSGERSFFIDETGVLRSNRANTAVQIGQVYGSWNPIEN
ncbi:MAG: HEAT repeat domain-containing protein [Acidobacteriota bacterium]